MMNVDATGTRHVRGVFTCGVDQVTEDPAPVQPAKELSEYEKFGRTFAAFVTSLEGEAGLGVGGAGGVETPGLSCEVGVQMDLFRARLDKEGFDLQGGVEFNAIISILGFDLGYRSIDLMSHIKNEQVVFDEGWVAESKESIQLFGSKAYIIYGGYFDVSFNYKRFFEELEKIYG